MIQFDHVSKSFSGKTVIDDLSFNVKKGELFTIIGPSGTGKSVTLKLISHLIAPTSGRVIVDGEDISEASDAQLTAIRRKIGYLFQNGALLGWMTLAENITLPLREREHLSDAEINDRLAKALEWVELEGHSDKYPSEVSGGMLKRAGFARAVIEGPQILLFDEPTSGLDPVMSRTIDSLISKINRKLGVTCVVVTHDLSGALRYADRIALLSKGRFAEVATPADFVKSQVPEAVNFLKAQFIIEKGVEHGPEQI